MNLETWKTALGWLTFAVLSLAVVAAALFDIPHKFMAPGFAMIAAAVHSVSLTDREQAGQVVGFVVKFSLVMAVMFSAYHWLLSQTDETSKIFLEIVASIGVFSVMPGIFVAVVELGENQARSNDPGEDSRTPDGPEKH